MAGDHLMGNQPETDDVELFVGGVESDARSAIETARFIEEYKKRLEYPLEAKEAQQLLAALGIDAGDYGMPDARSLLEHWHRCAAELLKGDVNGTDRSGAPQHDLEVGSGSPTEERK
jgi:hypothetical protein